MEMTGEYRIAAAREAVWQGLNDPAILKRCIPGCETIEKLSETEFTANVVLRIGPMQAKFGGKVTLADLDPPNGYTISGEGQGGVAGFGRGRAAVKLAPDGEGTVLRYSAEATVGGKIAQLGQRLVDATARKLADEFFGRFAEILAPVAEAAAETPVAAALVPAGLRLAPAIWIPLLIALVAALLFVFARG
ncbi:MAG: SRPBCC family protein [Pseudomonadota bacterium]